MASKKEPSANAGGPFHIICFLFSPYFMVASIFLSTRNLMNSVSPC